MFSSFPARRLEDAVSVLAFLGTASFALSMMSASVAVATFHAMVRRVRAEKA